MKTNVTLIIVILAIMPVIFVPIFYLNSIQPENSISEDFGNIMTKKPSGQQIGRGSDTVIASSSTDQNIPPIGACTGPLGQSGQKLHALQTEKLGQVPAVLEQLDSLTISCNGPDDIMKLPDTFTNMGGQCCGVLTNMTEYNEQIEGLKKFSYIPDVPSNPYNISIQHVKKILSYDKYTPLTSEQQTVLEQAAEMAAEGPCCCKCWHWYFNEGVAKELIIKYSFKAEQVAEFYDLSDTCGV
jgi:hypothetical protein